MSVKPILFNKKMVRAILDGRKTVTRRLIKDKLNESQEIKKNLKGEFELYDIHPRCGIPKGKIYKPPYHSGDILYVRERWSWCPCWDCGMDTEEHNCCDETANKIYNHDKREYGCYCYGASCKDNEYPSGDTWHPSIHMPREAARIFLEVTDVRVERLQDITEEQALSEGVPDDLDYPISKVYCPRCRGEGLIGSVGENLGYMEVDCTDCYTAIKRFKNLWNSTIKKSDVEIYGWKANPWVWIIEFERCEKPEGW